MELIDALCIASLGHDGEARKVIIEAREAIKARAYPHVVAMLREHADEILRRGETNLDATGEHIIEGHGRITWEMERP